jgi:hypothetical protein
MSFDGLTYVLVYIGCLGLCASPTPLLTVAFLLICVSFGLAVVQLLNWLVRGRPINSALLLMCFGTGILVGACALNSFILIGVTYLGAFYWLNELAQRGYATAVCLFVLSFIGLVVFLMQSLA